MTSQTQKIKRSTKLPTNKNKEELIEMINTLETESKYRLDVEHVIKLYLPDLKPGKSFTEVSVREEEIKGPVQGRCTSSAHRAH